MKTTPFARCPQTQRALRLLIPPEGPKVDRQKLIDSLPGPTPVETEELLDLIIQIILALLENKDKEDKPGPPEPGDTYDELQRITAEVATETISTGTLNRDVPKLVASIRKTASRIPSPGFDTNRAARESMRLANNKALGSSAINWKHWNTAVRNEMDNLDFDEHLKTTSDYQRAWFAIADALETLLASARMPII